MRFMVSRALFSSRDEDWETPQALFDALNNVFAFQLDACASAANAKCEHYFTEADDALAQDWSVHRRVWLNPPYGRAIAHFMEKAYRESRKGCLIACLTPARTDTRWWHDWVEAKAQVIFLRGRLRFARGGEPARAAAPFPSALIVYGLDVSWLGGSRSARSNRSADSAQAVYPQGQRAQ